MGSLQQKDTKTGRSEEASPLTPLTAPQPCPTPWLGPSSAAGRAQRGEGERRSSAQPAGPSNLSSSATEGRGDGSVPASGRDRDTPLTPWL